MADNIDVTPGTGKTVAAEEVGGVIYQQVKLVDSTATGTAPTGVAAKPFQVSLANTGANAIAVKVDGSAATQPVSGTVTAISGTAANLKAEVIGTGTFAVQATVAAGASTIGKAEDVASAGGDVGVPAMAIQLATPADTAADGDYAMLQMSAGRLWASAKIDTALPAGTNAIGKLAANSGVDIGDVDVATVGTITPGTAATSLGKAEDAAHTSGDVGVMGLAVRNDTRGTLAGTDLDYAPLQVNSAGDLRIASRNFGYGSATFSVQHNPAANTKATISQAAAGVGVKNVCTGFTVSLAAGASAPAAVQVTVQLVDGATTGTTYLWGPQVISLPATAGAMAAFVRSNLFIPGTANTALTLEFSAAGGANTIESVSFEGTTTT